jgi:hypothetical protein
VESHNSTTIQFDSADEHNAIRVSRKLTKLYADRSGQRWVVLDSEGEFWELPFVDNPWEHRRPFEPTEDSDLEPVPGHYKHLLGLPF